MSDDGDLYEVTYEDGTVETVRGWSLRMVADSATDPHHEPVKIERLPDPPSNKPIPVVPGRTYRVDIRW